MRLAVLMPVFDEGGRLGETLGELASLPAEITVFLVDDGSAVPVTFTGSLARNVDVVLARHVVNLGQGAALETARRLSLAPRFDRSFDAWVTMDADGQHRAIDVLALAEAVQAGADVALGDRFAGGSQVPRTRRVVLAMARLFERLTTGLALSDAHNGLRAFGPRAIGRMQITQNRMAHATELTHLISRSKLSVVEVPVSVRYSTDTLAKGQRASGALAILVDLFQGFLFGGRS